MRKAYATPFPYIYSTMSTALSYGDLELFPEDILGVGSYGKVCRAKLGQLPCAAKLLHQTMFESGDPGVGKFTERFLQEGQFLASIRHPNVVQYLASVREPQSGRPVLLMELMEESLTRFLESEVKPLPYHTQLGICYDVALALAYLHGNRIIHRDLSSNNVLLVGAGARAKVVDFGMSRLIDMNPRMTPLTQCPGTSVYMPPEALADSPHYSDKLDCFSWGVLAIQVLTGNFPTPTDARSFRDDIRYPTGRIIVLVPEVERRRKDLDLIDAEHPLRPLTLQCLRDKETERMSASDLCGRLGELKGEERYRESMELSRNQRSEISRLQQSLAEKMRELEAMEEAFAVRERENTGLREQLEAQKGVIQNTERELETCHQQYEEKKQLQLVEKKTLELEIAGLKQEMEERDKVTAARYEELVSNYACLEEKKATVEVTQKELEATLENSQQQLLTAHKSLVSEDEFKKEDEFKQVQQERVKQEALERKIVRLQQERAERMTKHEECYAYLEEIKVAQKEIEATLENSQHQLLAAHKSLKTLVTEEKRLVDGEASVKEELEVLKKQVKGTSCYDYKLQKQEIHAALHQRLKKGDTWYLVDVNWMKQWKRYVGYDNWDQSLAGQESANPGPIDNSNLLKVNRTLKEHLWEELDYFLLPKPAWKKLLSWYGITDGSQPLPRNVVECGLYMKHRKVEVYLLEFKLSLYSKQTEVITKQFSRANTVGLLELELRKAFSVSDDTHCRVWHRFMINTYELLCTASQTLQDAGLYNGQAVLLEVQNRDGTWPRSTSNTAEWRKS